MSHADATSAVEQDEHQGAPASRPLEIVFGAVALAFSAGYLLSLIHI